MKVECTLCFDYESVERASLVLGSVESDNPGFVNARVEGDCIVSNVVASSLSSLLHTLDDYLACVGVAEDTIEISRVGGRPGTMCRSRS